MKRILCVLISLSVALSLSAAGRGADAEKPDDRRPAVDAKAYILLEKNDLHTVAEQNARARLPIASTTKIMTAVIALENADLSKETTVSRNAAGTPGSSAYLRAGERVSVEDLLYFLMLNSANDAAVALAEEIAGSVERFAGIMNAKAKEIGMRDTHYLDPHGLTDEGHFSCAGDLALLTAYALNVPGFERIVSSKRRVCGSGEQSRTFVNHNRLLFTLPGCIGVKTGYTRAAGRCLVSACNRDGTTLICVTLGCRDDWNAHERLYDYGYSTVRRYDFPEREINVPVVGGASVSVECVYKGCSLLSFPDARTATVVECPHFLFAPLKDNEKVGSVLFLLDGKVTARADLLCASSVDRQTKPGLLARLFTMLTGWIGRDG